MAEIIFGDYVPEEKENPYTETVQKLADFNDEKKSVTLVVDVNDSPKEQFKFQRAANLIQKTARLRLTDSSDVKITGVDEDGNEIREGKVKLVFTLTKMQKARRRSKKATAGIGEEIDESELDSLAVEDVNEEVNA
jgi:hypothetical protein